MEGERTRRGGAAAVARVTFHQATRFSAATAASGTRAGGRARPSRAHLALPRLRVRLAVGGRVPIILDSIIKCCVITRYGALLLHPMGRERGGWAGVDRYAGMGARGDGGVCADVSGAVRVCVS